MEALGREDFKYTQYYRGFRKIKGCYSVIGFADMIITSGNDNLQRASFLGGKDAKG